MNEASVESSRHCNISSDDGSVVIPCIFHGKSVQMSTTVTPTYILFPVLVNRGPKFERGRTFLNVSFLEIQTLVDHTGHILWMDTLLTAKTYILVRVHLLYYLLSTNAYAF